jgi:hypothetical protein
VDGAPDARAPRQPLSPQCDVAGALQLAASAQRASAAMRRDRHL